MTGVDDGAARANAGLPSAEALAAPGRAFVVGFGAGAVLLPPHPAALTVDFAWPPTAAPQAGRKDPP